MREASVPSWAIILAGGDGTRLRPLTERIAGDGRPKQFCPVVGGETLLDQTRRRADLLVRADCQVIVVTRQHERYYAPIAHDILPGRLVVQPRNRGTGPGILYPLMRVEALAGNVPLCVFPSDHDVAADGAFMAYVRSAVEFVRTTPERVVLLGVEAATAETEYGWIEPAGPPLAFEGEPVFPIRRFWEKPTARLAEVLLERGCLWNSFVMVGWVGAFWRLFERTLPVLVSEFEALRAALDTPAEETIAEQVYALLSEVNFSDRVLARMTEHLATIRLKDIEWSDLGNPARVVASLRRRGRRPAWLAGMGLPSTA